MDLSEFKKQFGDKKIKAVCKATLRGDLRCLVYANLHGYQMTRSDQFDAAIGGDLKCFIFITEILNKMYQNCLDYILRRKNVNIIKYAGSCFGYFWYFEKVCSISTLNYIKSRGAALDPRYVGAALKYGNLECLRFVVNSMCEKYPFSSLYLANHVPKNNPIIVKYLLCLLESDACMFVEATFKKGKSPAVLSDKFDLYRGVVADISERIY
jgi:hypothetical protein